MYVINKWLNAANQTFKNKHCVSSKAFFLSRFWIQKGFLEYFDDICVYLLF